MLKQLSFRVFGFIVFSFFCSFAFAQNSEQGIAQLNSRVELLERKLFAQELKIDEQAKTQETLDNIKKTFDGLTISAGSTFIVQTTHNANGDDLSKNSEDVTDASHSMDLEFEKKFDDGAIAFIHLETGDGAGVEDELKVFSNVNQDADDSNSSVNATEVWYEYYSKSAPVTVTFGKIDSTCYLDTNVYADDECTRFLGHIFRNSPVIEFPDDNAAGIRFLLEPAEWFDIETQILDANADGEDMFDNVFVSSQFNIKPNFMGRPGNYRVYGWLNDKEHTKWIDPSKTKEKGFGIGVSFDQELSDKLGLFARYGWQDPDVFASGDDFSLAQSWSMGLQLQGSIWGRDEDSFAIAFGQVIASDEYKKANFLNAKSEEHLEVYYSFKINEHLTFIPDLQLICDPYGGDAANGDKTIVVGGVRTQVDF